MVLFDFKCERCYQLEVYEPNESVHPHPLPSLLRIPSSGHLSPLHGCAARSDRAVFLSIFTRMMEGRADVALGRLIKSAPPPPQQR